MEMVYIATTAEKYMTTKINYVHIANNYCPQ